MKKLLVILFTVLFFTLSCSAKTVKKDFAAVINSSGVDKESIAISIKDANSGKVVYSLNDKMLMNPASVQKLLTTPVSMEILGEDYCFTTGIYKRDANSYLIKLGADPYLTSSDLKTLVKKVDDNVQKIYIDDTVLDNKTWGEGWQWDDDMNILMPKFGSYNLDKNLIKLTIIPDDNGKFATIINPSKYPLVFFNQITVAEKTDIKIHRDNAVSANTLIMEGTVARPTTVYIPVNNLHRYFDIQLTRNLQERNIYLKTPYIKTNLNPNDTLCEEVTHNISNAVDDILKNSNNMVSETLFKLAGGKYIGGKYIGGKSNVDVSNSVATGTDVAGIKMFNDYCVRNNLDNSRIKITDASGVSKNNLVSADFITDFLVLNNNNKIMEHLPSPGEGTLTHRMLPIKDSLKAKTGTLSDVSSIAGYLTSTKGNKYVFCIITNDMQLSSSDKKMLEDYIIREDYLNL